MSSNRVTVTGDCLVVEPAGFSKVWSFTRRLQFPLANVREATFDPGMRDEPKGWRGPGIGLPGRLAGTFHADGRKQFWNGAARNAWCIDEEHLSWPMCTHVVPSRRRSFLTCGLVTFIDGQADKSVAADGADVQNSGSHFATARSIENGRVRLAAHAARRYSGRPSMTIPLRSRLIFAANLVASTTASRRPAIARPMSSRCGRTRESARSR